MTPASLRSVLAGALALGLLAPGPSSTAGELAARRPHRVASSTARAEECYDQALTLAASGQKPAAEKALREALEADPLQRDARRALVVLLAGERRFDEALALVREGRAVDPRHFDYVLLEARIRAAAGDDAGALALLEAVGPVLTTTDADALRATLYRRQGRYADAARLYSAMLEREPGRAAWWLGLALSHEGRHSALHALAAYRRAQRAGVLDASAEVFVEARIAALERERSFFAVAGAER